LLITFADDFADDIEDTEDNLNGIGGYETYATIYGYAYQVAVDLVSVVTFRADPSW